MNLKKFIATIVVCCFTFSFILSDTLHAALELKEENAAARQISRIPANSIIPRSCGRITDSASFGGRQLIVNIQDLHCHPEIQRNIAKILAALDKEYGLKNVYVEGGYGDIDTSWLCNFGDQTLKKEILENLVDQGKLTGSEYFSVLANRPDALKGLEDEALHKANLVRLGKILDRQEFFKSRIKELDKDLAFMKARYFSSRSQRFNDLVAKYAAGKIEAGKYYRLLAQYARDIDRHSDRYNTVLPVSGEDYPNINTYLELQERARHIHYRQLSRQLQLCLQSLKSRLPYSEYNLLITRTGNFTNTDELCRLLAETARSRNFDIATAYPELQNFIEYTDKNRTLNPLRLLAEEKRLVREIRLGLSENTAELEVSFLTDFYGYFQDYLLNRLTADDYEYFTAKFDKFRSVWGKYAFRNRIDDLSADFPLLSEFYAANNERNYCFLKNLGLTGDDANLPASNATPAENTGASVIDLLGKAEVVVVVTGGFHTAGLQKLLKVKRISSLSITPNVTQDTRFSSEVYTKFAKLQAKIFANALALGLASQLTSPELFKLALAAANRELEKTGITAQQRQALLKKIAKAAGLEILSDENGIVKFSNGAQISLKEIDGILKAEAVKGAPAGQAVKEAVDKALKEALASLKRVKSLNDAVDKALIGQPGDLIEILAAFAAEHDLLKNNALIYEISQDPTLTNRDEINKIPVELLARFPGYLQWDEAQQEKFTQSLQGREDWLQILLAVDLLNDHIMAAIVRKSTADKGQEGNTRKKSIRQGHQMHINLLQILLTVGFISWILPRNGKKNNGEQDFEEEKTAKGDEIVNQNEKIRLLVEDLKTQLSLPAIGFSLGEPNAAALVQLLQQKPEYIADLERETVELQQSATPGEKNEHIKSILQRLNTILPLWRPLLDVPVNTEEREMWIKANVPGEQALARTMTEKIEYIRQEVFEKELEKTVQDFNTKMQGKPYLLFIPVVNGKRSENWVFQLAKEKGLYPPRKVVYFTNKYFYYGDDPDKMYTDFERLISETGIRDAAFIDDASYSGDRLYTYIDTAVQWNEKHSINVHVIVPFMTGDAEKLLAEVQKQRRPWISEVFLYKHRVTRVLGDLWEYSFHAKDASFLQKAYSFMPLSYMQHKAHGQFRERRGTTMEFRSLIPSIEPPYSTIYLELIFRKLDAFSEKATSDAKNAGQMFPPRNEKLPEKSQITDQLEAPVEDELLENGDDSDSSSFSAVSIALQDFLRVVGLDLEDESIDLAKSIIERFTGKENGDFVLASEPGSVVSKEPPLTLQQRANDLNARLKNYSETTKLKTSNTKVVVTRGNNTFVKYGNRIAGIPAFLHQANDGSLALYIHQEFLNALYAEKEKRAKEGMAALPRGDIVQEFISEEVDELLKIRDLQKEEKLTPIQAYFKHHLRTADQPPAHHPLITLLAEKSGITVLGLENIYQPTVIRPGSILLPGNEASVIAQDTFKPRYFTDEMTRKVLSSFAELMDHVQFVFVDEGTGFTIEKHEPREIEGTIFENEGYDRRKITVTTTIRIAKDISFVSMLNLAGRLYEDMQNESGGSKGEQYKQLLENKQKEIEKIAKNFMYAADYLDSVKSVWPEELGIAGTAQGKELTAYLDTIIAGFRNLTDGYVVQETDTPEKQKAIAESWLGIDEGWWSVVKTEIEKESAAKRLGMLKLWFAADENSWARNIAWELAAPAREIDAAVMEKGGRLLDTIKSKNYPSLTLLQEIDMEMSGISPANPEYSERLMNVIEKRVGEYYDDSLHGESLSDDLKNHAEALGVDPSELASVNEISPSIIIETEHMVCIMKSYLSGRILQQKGYSVYWLDVQESVGGEQEGHVAVLVKMPDGRYRIVDAAYPRGAGYIPGEYLAEREAEQRLAGSMVYPKTLDTRSSSLHHAIRITAFEPGARNSVYNNLGTVLLSQKRYVEAESAFRKALEIYPKDAKAWDNLGTALSYQNRYTEAENAYKKAQEINPQFASPWNNQGNQYLAQKRYAKAERVYLKALEIDPQDVGAWNNLGNTRFFQERYAEAESAYLKALEINPQYAFAWRNLAVSLTRRNMTAAAQIAISYYTRVEQGETIDTEKAFAEIDAAKSKEKGLAANQGGEINREQPGQDTSRDISSAGAAWATVVSAVPFVAALGLGLVSGNLWDAASLAVLTVPPVVLNVFYWHIRAIGKRAGPEEYEQGSTYPLTAKFSATIDNQTGFIKARDGILFISPSLAAFLGSLPSWLRTVYLYGTGILSHEMLHLLTPGLNGFKGELLAWGVGQGIPLGIGVIAGLILSALGAPLAAGVLGAVVIAGIVSSSISVVAEAFGNSELIYAENDDELQKERDLLIGELKAQNIFDKTYSNIEVLSMAVLAVAMTTVFVYDPLFAVIGLLVMTSASFVLALLSFTRNLLFNRNELKVVHYNPFAAGSSSWRTFAIGFDGLWDIGEVWRDYSSIFKNLMRMEVYLVPGIVLITVELLFDLVIGMIIGINIVGKKKEPLITALRLHAGFKPSKFMHDVFNRLAYVQNEDENKLVAFEMLYNQVIIETRDIWQDTSENNIYNASEIEVFKLLKSMDIHHYQEIVDKVRDTNSALYETALEGVKLINPLIAFVIMKGKIYGYEDAITKIRKDWEKAHLNADLALYDLLYGKGDGQYGIDGYVTYELLWIMDLNRPFTKTDLLGEESGETIEKLKEVRIISNADTGNGYVLTDDFKQRYAKTVGALINNNESISKQGQNQKKSKTGIGADSDSSSFSAVSIALQDFLRVVGLDLEDESINLAKSIIERFTGKENGDFVLASEQGAEVSKEPPLTLQQRANDLNERLEKYSKTTGLKTNNTKVVVTRGNNTFVKYGNRIAGIPSFLHQGNDGSLTLYIHQEFLNALYAEKEKRAKEGMAALPRGDIVQEFISEEVDELLKIRDLQKEEKLTPIQAYFKHHLRTADQPPAHHPLITLLAEKTGIIILGLENVYHPTVIRPGSILLPGNEASVITQVPFKPQYFTDEMTRKVLSSFAELMDHVQFVFVDEGTGFTIEKHEPREIEGTIFENEGFERRKIKVTTTITIAKGISFVSMLNLAGRLYEDMQNESGGSKGEQYKQLLENKQKEIEKIAKNFMYAADYLDSVKSAWPEELGIAGTAQGKQLTAYLDTIIAGFRNLTDGYVIQETDTPEKQKAIAESWLGIDEGWWSVVKAEINNEPADKRFGALKLWFAADENSWARNIAWELAAPAREIDAVVMEKGGRLLDTIQGKWTLHDKYLWTRRILFTKNKNRNRWIRTIWSPSRTLLQEIDIEMSGTSPADPEYSERLMNVVQKRVSKYYDYSLAGNNTKSLSDDLKNLAKALGVDPSVLALVNQISPSIIIETEHMACVMKSYLSGRILQQKGFSVYWLNVQETVGGKQEEHAAVLAKMPDGRYRIVDAANPGGAGYIPGEYLMEGEVEQGLAGSMVYPKILDTRSSSLHHAIRITAFERGARSSVYNNLGNSLFTQKRYTEAESADRKALEINPQDANAWNNLGNALLSQNRYAEAENAYRKALEINPQDADTWNNLGTALFHQKRYAEAESAYRKALEINPQHVGAWNNLGTALYSQKRYTEAEIAYRKALEIDPQKADVWNNLGNTLFFQNRYAEAESAYRKVLEINPQNADALINLGNVLFLQNRHTEAEIAYRKALEIDSQNAMAWYNLAISLSRQDMPAASQIAKSYYTRAMQGETIDIEKAFAEIDTAKAEVQGKNSTIRVSVQDILLVGLPFRGTSKEKISNGRILFSARQLREQLLKMKQTKGTAITAWVKNVVKLPSSGKQIEGEKNLKSNRMLLSYTRLLVAALLVVISLYTIFVPMSMHVSYVFFLTRSGFPWAFPVKARGLIIVSSIAVATIVDFFIKKKMQGNNGTPIDNNNAVRSNAKRDMKQATERRWENVVESLFANKGILTVLVVGTLLIGAYFNPLIISAFMNYSESWNIGPLFIPFYIYGFMIAPLLEEVVFRKPLVMLDSITDNKTVHKAAIVVLATVFAAGHVHAYPVLSLMMLNAFVNGIFFGYLSIKYKSIVPSILAHMYGNLLFLIAQVDIRIVPLLVLWPVLAVVKGAVVEPYINKKSLSGNKVTAVQGGTESREGKFSPALTALQKLLFVNAVFIGNSSLTKTKARHYVLQLRDQWSKVTQKLSGARGMAVQTDEFGELSQPRAYDAGQIYDGTANVAHIVRHTDLPTDMERFRNERDIAHVWFTDLTKDAPAGLEPLDIKVYVGPRLVKVWQKVKDGATVYYVDLQGAGILNEETSSQLRQAAAQIISYLVGTDNLPGVREGFSLDMVVDHTDKPVNIIAPFITMNITKPAFVPVAELAGNDLEVNPAIRRRLIRHAAMQHDMRENKILKIDDINIDRRTGEKIDPFEEFIRFLNVFRAAGAGQLLVDWSILQWAMNEKRLSRQQLKKMLRLARYNGDDKRVPVHAAFKVTDRTTVAEIEKLYKLGFASVGLDLKDVSPENARQLVEGLKDRKLLYVVNVPAGSTLADVPVMVKPDALEGQADEKIVVDTELPQNADHNALVEYLEKLPQAGTIIFHYRDVKELVDAARDMTDQKALISFLNILVNLGTSRITTPEQAAQRGYNWPVKSLPVLDQAQLAALIRGDIDAAGLGMHSAIREQADEISDGKVRTAFLQAIAGNMLVRDRLMLKQRELGEAFVKGTYRIERDQMRLLADLLTRELTMSKADLEKDHRGAEALQKEIGTAADDSLILELRREVANNKPRSGAVTVVIGLMLQDIIVDYNLRQAAKKKQEHFSTEGMRHLLAAA